MSDDHRIGYKRPPTKTRFRPGASGNPGGRPKRRPSFRDTLYAQLAGPASVGGSRPPATNLQEMVRTLVKAAIAGDARAQALVVGALTRFDDSGEQEAAPLTSDDQQILEAYAASEERAAIDGTSAASDNGGDQITTVDAATVAPSESETPK